METPAATTTRYSLPPELLVRVLRFLSVDELDNARLLNRLFAGVVRNHRRSLARRPYHVRISMEGNLVLIEHNRPCCRKWDLQLLDIFDFAIWESIEITSFELKSVRVDETNIEEVCRAFQLICHNLVATHQNAISSLSFRNVKLPESCASSLQKLFATTIANCKQLLFRDCVLPTSLSPEMIERLSLFDHYRWLDCISCDQGNSADTVIRKFACEMAKPSRERKSFLAEVNCVNVTAVCDFIQAWMTAKTATFFNLSVGSCDEAWREAFSAECRRRGLTHTYWEFASKTHTSAHIKVNFVDDNMCRIWPIFDIPARSPGQMICYARYFRDF